MKREPQGVVVFHDGSSEEIFSREDLERHFGRTDTSPYLAAITKFSAISREELEAMVSPHGKIVELERKVMFWPVSMHREPDPDGIVLIEEVDVQFERAVPVSIKESLEIADKHDVCVAIEEDDS